MALISMKKSYNENGGLKWENIRLTKELPKFTLDDLYEIVENYEESNGQTESASMEAFYQAQEKEAENYIQICEDVMEKIKTEQKWLEEVGKVLSKNYDVLAISIRANEDAIAGLVADYQYGTMVEETFEISVEEWNQLDYDARRQLVIEKTPRGKEYYDNLVRFQKEIDDATSRETGGVFKTYQEYETRVKECEGDLTVVKASKYALEQEKKEYPYKVLAATDEFLKYAADWSISPPVTDISGLYEDLEGFYSGTINEVALANTLANSPNKYKAFHLLSKIRYDLLDEQDKMMYCYLYETKGREAAQEYLKAIEDRINKKEALREKDEFIKSITDENGKIKGDVGSILLSSGKGFVDGIENWGEGVANIFNKEGMISTNQYAQMYILDELESSLGLRLGYESGVAVGNTTPSILASTLVSIVGTPAAGKATGLVLLGASAGGNAKNQAMIDGNDLPVSNFYGAVVGISSASLSYVIGKIPGLSMEAGLSLKNAALGGMNRAALSLVKAGAQAVLLEETVDFTGLTAETINSFLVGALSTATMNGVGQVLHLTVNGENINVSLQKILQFVEDHKDCRLIEALKASIPAIYGDALSGFGDTSAPTPDFAQAVQRYDTTYGMNHHSDFIYDVNHRM